MRETWLSENQRLVSQDNFGFDLAAVEAAAKKHEAIETDIFAYEERVQAVISVASGILLLFFIFRIEFKSNSNRIRISIEMTEIRIRIEFQSSSCLFTTFVLCFQNWKLKNTTTLIELTPDEITFYVYGIIYWNC